MQKKIIALAIAGLVSGAAFADGSSVTIYGIADGSFDVIKTSGATDPTNLGLNTGSYNRVSTNSSYIGFKGAEDLGNGVKALFQFENGVGFDSAGAGTGGIFGSARDSYVGLNGGFGTVLLGTLTGPARALGNAVDVNAGATGIGYSGALLGKLGGVTNARLDTTAGAIVTPTSYTAPGFVANTCGRSATCTSGFDTRYNNSIAYVSPNFGGFSFSGGYMADENKSNNASTAGAALTQANSSGYELGGTFAGGPITVLGSYSNIRIRNNIDSEAKDARLAGIFNFGAGDVRLLWEQTKGSSQGFAAVGAVGEELKQTVWGAGLTFKVGGNGKLLTQYYKANNLSGSGATTFSPTTGLSTGPAGLPFVYGSGTGAKLFELGYEHSLSKRTTLKAIYSRLTNDTNARYDYGINATGITAAGIDLNGFQFGVRHAF